MKSYESLSAALDDLKKRGYEAGFEVDSDSLYCTTQEVRLHEDEFHIDEVYRFEGDPAPGDCCILFAFTSPTGVKGTILDRSGAPYRDDNFALANKLRYHADMADK
jgi:hypothetical protein